MILRNTLWILALLALSPVTQAQNTRPNVLLICVDDLRPELRCFGKDYISSPNIDDLAERGRAFHQHYVQAPTCGASRYTLLTGTYGSSSNKALFKRSGMIKNPSFPAYFRNQGYTTVSIGKVSHHPGGWGGDDWDDSNKLEMPNSWDRHLLPAGAWRHPRGWMHGLANGEIRGNAKEMDVFQSLAGPDEIYPDGGSVTEALAQMESLGNATREKPFFLAVGILRPHLPFGAPAKYLDLYKEVTLPEIPHPNKPTGKTTWHNSGEFMKYNRWGRDPNTDSKFATDVRKHYAACVSYADAQVGRIMEKLDSLELRENTVVILWGDHGWHLGEHGIWGKHALFEESLHSPMIISYPDIPQPGIPTNSIVETIDIFPTVCDLVGLDKPKFLDGVSLNTILEDPKAKGHSAIAYKQDKVTIRTKNHRLIIGKNHVELYDHSSPEGEAKNIAAQNPELVKELTQRLKAKHGQ